jgi:hypothetical protein
MPDDVTMQFVSSTGTYIFAKDAMPLFGRRPEYARATDQGPAGNRRINCTLNGFFAANNHHDVIAEYQKLLQVIKSNDALFTYRVTNGSDTITVVDTRVYMNDYTEPADWKQYTGDFSLGFHYFELPVQVTSDLGILAVYRPTTGTPYIFSPTPHWAGSFKSNRPNFRGPRITPSGRPIASETTVTLSGRLAAENHADLAGKVNALTQALQFDGTLDYGVWSNAVRVEDFQIPSVFPRNYVDYQIVFKYDSPGIVKFNSKRIIGRLNGSPKITELPFCGQVRTQVFLPLGQTISYYVSCQAYKVQDARDAIAAELGNIIIGGGIEMEGGREEWNDSECEVSLSCTKYYFPPVVNNLTGS